MYVCVVVLRKDVCVCVCVCMCACMYLVTGPWSFYKAFHAIQPVFVFTTNICEIRTYQLLLSVLECATNHSEYRLAGISGTNLCLTLNLPPQLFSNLRETSPSLWQGKQFL